MCNSVQATRRCRVISFNWLLLSSSLFVLLLGSPRHSCSQACPHEANILAAVNFDRPPALGLISRLGAEASSMSEGGVCLQQRGWAGAGGTKDAQLRKDRTRTAYTNQFSYQAVKYNIPLALLFCVRINCRGRTACSQSSANWGFCFCLLFFFFFLLFFLATMFLIQVSVPDDHQHYQVVQTRQL